MSTAGLTEHCTQANIPDLHFKILRNQEKLSKADFMKLLNHCVHVSQAMNKHPLSSQG